MALVQPRKPLVSWRTADRRHSLVAAYANAIDDALRGESDFAYPLTVRPDPADFRDVYYTPSLVEIPAFMAPIETPQEKFKPETLLVRHQSVEGTCTGQALAAVIDMQNAKRRRDGADLPWRVSARMLYSAARLFDEFPDDNLPGSSIRGAIKGFWHRGACSEAEMPYLAGLDNSALSVAIVKDARKVALGAYFRLRHVLNDYHAALTEAGAILVSAMIHKGWEPASVRSKNGQIFISKKRPPKLQGAHAFAIVGFTSKGFLVLNSWGPNWGRFDLSRNLTSSLARAELAEVIKRRNVHEGDLPGIALWSYEDWQEHVLDAWVLRLAAPTLKRSGTVGGYKFPGIRADKEVAVARAVKESDVIGHLIHLKDHSLVTSGLYATSHNDLRATARLFERGRYKHLLFHAHGALDTRDQALERARAMIPVFKRNGVYPIFFIWRTGFDSLTAELLSVVANSVRSKAGDQLEEVTDNLLENAVRPVAAPLWEQMKVNAKQAFDGPNAQGLVGFKMLADAAIANKMKLHLCSQSGGAILLAYLIAELGSQYQFASTSLLAPACPFRLFNRTFRANLSQSGDALIYNLPESRERSSDETLPLYSKSILWLVARAFEKKGQTNLVGIEEHWKEQKPGMPRVVANASGRKSHAMRHGGFDNDIVTMNHILSRMIERDKTDSNGGFRSSEIGDETLF